MQRELLEPASGSGRYAKVSLPVPVDKRFTYAVPAEMAGGIFVGARVDVPFGRRTLSGIVTELTDSSDLPRIKSIKGLYETFLTPELLTISRWIADYYGCTEGEAMQAALPPSLRRAKVKPRPTGIVRVSDRRILDAGVESEEMDAVRAQLSRAKKQIAMFQELVGAGGEAPLPVVVSEWGYNRPVVDALIERGLVQLDAAPRKGSRLDAMDAEVTELTEAQTQALATIIEAIESREFHPSLLYGVTGSGKTEVYLRAARHVLGDGGGVIVLVPEIGLLPQATARYRRMFGEQVAIIHSRLTGPERFDIWEKVEKGEFRIVVGPRSAIFMPVRDLRMVIVDEEQDDSYKQDDKPRYHARAVAMMRGKLEDLTVVLGSATPSAESLRQASDGRYDSLRLPDRVGGSPLPNVELVDMRGTDHKSNFFSPSLIDRLEENIEAGHQSIIFLNKRGHARFVQCNACGWVASCRNCDISLTYHRTDNTLRCHFCGYARRVVRECDTCKGTKLFFSGVGTQRIELDLMNLFPGANVLRMDADTTTGKEGHQRILEEFSTGNYPILLGTQMVTKGHHFPGVSLVGALYAEEGLNFPDFRSAERTFQMLTQVGGRAGRGGEPGDVLIQTYMPDHYVFRYLLTHDYDGFMAEELETRRLLRYPPYARIVLASCSSPNPNVLRMVMAEWADKTRFILAERISAGRVEVLGPTPPLVARVKNRFREQMLIKGTLSRDEKRKVLALLDDITGRVKGASSVELRWDVDPESFF
jgi:primosomal protein N' (replication factor Y)